MSNAWALAALESLVADKDAAIARLEGQVDGLSQMTKELKQTHKMELQEMNVRIQQEMYMAKHFGELGGGGGPVGKQAAGSRGRGGRTKSKLKTT